MKHLIVGTILSFLGIGLIANSLGLFGIIFLLIGIFLGIKGRGEID